MSEHLQRTFAICATILVVGIVFSLMLSANVAKFDESFRLKDFYDRNTSPDVTDTYQTIRLNDKQLAVVSERGKVVDIYQVDANGKITRTSDTEE